VIRRRRDRSAREQLQLLEFKPDPPQHAYGVRLPGFTSRRQFEVAQNRQAEIEAAAQRCAAQQNKNARLSCTRHEKSHDEPCHGHRAARNPLT